MQSVPARINDLAILAAVLPRCGGSGSEIQLHDRYITVTRPYHLVGSFPGRQEVLEAGRVNAMSQHNFAGRGFYLAVPSLILGLVTGCAGDRAASGDELRGAVHIDGSSTVYPVTEAVVEEFQAAHRGVRVAVGVSGTGGGFEKFCAGEAEIADASRAIKPSELERCRSHGVDPVGYPIAVDGLSVVVNPANEFVSCLTVDELRRIWEPGSGVETWRDVRPEWPEQRIDLYGPGVDSGTFDYFTERIVGEEDASRPDYAASEDDNVLVSGVAGDRFALGYFGHHYYVENSDVLKLVAIDAGDGCVLPSAETIRSGEYSPLTRPLYVFVDRPQLDREEVVAFLRYYVENASRLAPAVGYVALPDSAYEEVLSAIG
jgi:phosphate transport system substrate-binding protein